jgi:hypothetical protein
VLFHYYMPSRAVALRTALEWFRTPSLATPNHAPTLTPSSRAAA